jgi:two-component system response regulator PilR (NtrC family)
MDAEPAVPASILIVDDEATFRERFVRALERHGYRCAAAGDQKQALAEIADNNFDVAFIDIRLPDGSGLDLLKSLAERCPQTAVFMITAYAGLDSAVQALRQGAVDYVTKPFVFDNALHRLARLLQHRQVLVENQLLRRELGGYNASGELIGESVAMQDVLRAIDRAAPTPSTV